MKHIIAILALAVLAVTLTACGGGSTFKISANIDGMGNQNLHVVFLGDSGVSDAFIPSQDNTFKIQGSSTDLTIVSILDSQNKPLLRIAAQGGQSLEITGDINNPHHYKCKGSDVAQEWMEFETENASLYDMVDHTKLDQAIEKYVKENPKSVVSTLLVVADYSQLTTAKGAALLESIDAEARPESLVKSAQQALELAGKPDTQLHTMMLYGINSDFEPFSPNNSTATLIYWWNNCDEARSTSIERIKQLEQQYGTRLAVADVNLSPDTAGWHATVINDATHWRHLWAPGSVLDPAIQSLRINSLPLCIVTDSVGKQIYRGDDINAASAALAKCIK